MEFTKMQGAGNDFILVEDSSLSRDWATVAVKMCHRHFGIGGDGLLLVKIRDKTNLEMRIFNSDGSEAEACGNGLRCVVRYALERGITSADSGAISVDTRAGIRKARINKKANSRHQIQVAMGLPEFRPEKIPVVISATNTLNIKIPFKQIVSVLGREILLHFVSMGNPHAVYFWDKDVADFPLAELGPKVEHHEMFTNRVNFEVARLISRREIEARVWERGAGETLACGTGACAIAVTAQQLGYTDNQVDIRLPGGTLNIEWNGSGEVLLGGPAEIVFTGNWPDR
jgi:diaminopimelate epimerase